VLFALVVFVFRALVSLVFSFTCMYVGRDVYRKNGQCCFVSTQRWDFFFFSWGSFMSFKFLPEFLKSFSNFL
jgi:hypothetical protein